jgi:3-hydroxyacyl-CoA dehydrogenase
MREIRTVLVVGAGTMGAGGLVTERKEVGLLILTY